MTRFFCQYIGWLVIAAMRASGNKVAATKAVVKSAGSGIGLAIFPVINKTINNDKKNWGMGGVLLCHGWVAK